LRRAMENFESVFGQYIWNWKIEWWQEDHTHKWEIFEEI